MKKVLIIGNSGSGKSWLSARLSKHLQVKEVNLDSIVWERGGFNKKRPEDVVDTALKMLLYESSWVVEGVFGALAEKLVKSADTLLFLDINWPICESSLLSRGPGSSIQLDSDIAQKNFQELLHWASEYSTRQSKSSRGFHDKLYDQFAGSKTRFTTREEVTSFIAIMVG